MAGKAAKKKGIATVFTVHGTYYPKHEIRKLIEISDSVVCVSPPLCSYMKGLSVKNPFLVANGIDLQEYRDTSFSEDLRNHMKIPENSVVVLYGSRITGEKQMSV